MTYREFIARLRDFGVVEYRGRGKGGERFLVRETVPGSGKGPSYTIGYHGDAKDVPKVREGWDYKRIMAIAGHKTFAVFQRYNNPTEEDLKEVVLADAPRKVVG